MIAAALRQAAPSAELTLLDADVLALTAARLNVKGAEIVLSNCFSGQLTHSTPSLELISFWVLEGVGRQSVVVAPTKYDPRD